MKMRKDICVMFYRSNVEDIVAGYAVSQIILDAGSAILRLIEVKGRVAGAFTVIITKNETLTALNKPDEYIPAIIEVDGEKMKVVYLEKPFRERPDFAATSVNYIITEPVNASEVILERQEI